jgi:starvation-inducible outer membrane lipoprotein
VLKRERNELTVQLVEAREERMQMQLKLLEANRPGKVAKEKKGEVEEVGAPTSTADMAKGEYFKQLSGKIIEIENKLSIATKREVRVLSVSLSPTHQPRQHLFSIGRLSARPRGDRDSQHYTQGGPR